MTKRELQVGDKVRVEDSSLNRLQYYPVEVIHSLGYFTAGDVPIHRRQVTHVKRKAKKRPFTTEYVEALEKQNEDMTNRVSELKDRLASAQQTIEFMRKELGRK